MRPGNVVVQPLLSIVVTVVVVVVVVGLVTVFVSLLGFYVAAACIFYERVAPETLKL